ncbi:alpha/beta fold hydrolase [Cellulomonas alba]|uniref:Alpha/beta hydrolase n=1 Tax=Cellulomonas alba TaxID=3053467 RepID=A0ABT7SL77_9CELL|nr:alpha/beta hydrolase [Cellulomonas alba]MDM7856289.1 alpha/beta hydrolase [Cellulomonas alba]
MSDKPTIVLVHGAFADASGWGGVITRLQADGYTTYAPANHLRGVAHDAGYIQDFVATIDGPVVLVGHSYGGAVITNVHAENVVALVYICAFALDEGEAVGQALALGGEPVDLSPVLVVRPYPGAPEGTGDAYINPAVFHDAFCQDVPAELAAIMAAAQRPGSLVSLAEPSGTPAWRTTPSWYMVGQQDRVIPPDAERAMAKRAGATTVEVDSSHVAMISRPDDVAALVRSAVAGVAS